MYTGFAVLIVGPLVPPLGQLLGSVCDANLWAIEYCIAQGQRPWGNHVWSPPPPWWWVAVFYTVFLAWAFLPQWKSRRFWGMTLLISWFAAGLFLSTSPLPNLGTNEQAGLRCTFVAVGHGTSVLVETSDGRNLLYDAGKLGSPVGAARPISALLWSRGITRLDSIVISHADADHFNAVPDLLQRYQVGEILVSPFMFERLDQPAVRTLKDVIDKSQVPVRTITSSDRLQLGDDVDVEILHPTPQGVIGSDNAHSLVVLLQYAGRKVLLPGDLESPGLDHVLAELPIDCDIVMTPHHGSKRSDPRGTVRLEPHTESNS
ncbi:ComEC family competence protein [Anatilimnocola aggregata]|uniref:ComEC family competence protein n=2 Tax=Anatilimnocola aggregata TaxID=2528021 RepID=A0A517YNJ4_9BACT|nr:ComEC family competence protein [Anatilimnocola aggregata]